MRGRCSLRAACAPKVARLMELDSKEYACLVTMPPQELPKLHLHTCQDLADQAANCIRFPQQKCALPQRPMQHTREEPPSLLLKRLLLMSFRASLIQQDLLRGTDWLPQTVWCSCWACMGQSRPASTISLQDCAGPAHGQH